MEEGRHRRPPHHQGQGPVPPPSDSPRGDAAMSFPICRAPGQVLAESLPPWAADGEGTLGCVSPVGPRALVAPPPPRPLQNLLRELLSRGRPAVQEGQLELDTVALPGGIPSTPKTFGALGCHCTALPSPTETVVG